jgi:hypothetical protein
MANKIDASSQRSCQQLLLSPMNDVAMQFWCSGDGNKHVDVHQTECMTVYEIIVVVDDDNNKW